MKAILVSLFCLATMTACGASAIQQGARAIHPQNNAEPASTWIYFETSDKGLNGVYRCYDNDRKPVCKKAKLQ